MAMLRHVPTLLNSSSSFVSPSDTFSLVLKQLPSMEDGGRGS